MLDTHQSKPFIGVRFVLFGFEPNNQLQVKSKLINGGGVDADPYGQDCTHVIVDSVVYGDHVCIEARNDGKILVTGLWVHHSFDNGVPVDHTSIIYRPLKVLNGIPGAKSLVMCLTGYLRQDRDDVMTMVGLMGAQFSKPLVANKVTHLICYKFEGEKYELAKKMKIKLVNHQWLADCLSHWQIIPEANYSESGYELEMKSEVKDSEEEAEDNIAMQFRGMKMNLSPRKIKTEISSPHNLNTPVGIESKILLDTNVSVSNVTNHEDMQSATIKATSSNKTSSLNMPDEKTPNSMVSHQPEHFQVSPISIKVENDFTCSSESATNASSSGVNKFSGMTYSRKKTKRSALQTDISSNLSGILQIVPVEIKISDGLNISHNGTGLTPQKRKMNATCANSKSESISQNSIKSKSVSPSGSNEVHRSELTPLTHGPSDINIGLSINNNSIPQNEPSVLKSDKRSPADMFINKSSYIRLDSTDEKALQNSYGNSKKSTDIASGISVLEVGEIQQDVDGSSSQHKTTVFVKSNSFLVPSGEKDDLLLNRADQKSFGSTKKQGMRRNTKCKGFIVLDKIASQNKNAEFSVEEKRTVKYMEPSHGNKFEELSSPDSLRTSMKISNIDISKSFKDIEYDTMANQTIVADEEDDELEKADNQKSVLAHSVQNLDSMMEETSDVREHIINPITKNATSMEGVHEKEVDATNTKEEKLACVKSSVKEKMPKRQKRVNTEKICKKSQMEKKGPNNAAGKNKNMVPVSKLQNSVEPKKEDKPKIIDNKSVLGNKQCVKSATTKKVALKSNRKALKMIQNDVEVENESLQAKEAPNKVKPEPIWFILSGRALQKKEFQQNLRLLKGKICRDSHQWSYQATHFIVPDPIRRTEKFFAAAAAGRWILKSDYLRNSSQAGKLLPEEPYEWHQNGLSEDGAINLEAPRKWRLLQEKTGHGAFHGMRIIIYGDCIAPPLDTLKRAVKAGGGTILATSPPYTKFLNSGVDFAVVSPEMPRADIWVHEFLKHEVPCVVADYLVEYVCKPGYSIERHVQFNTHSWAEKSLALMMSR